MIFKQGGANGIGVDTASTPAAVFDGKWIPWHIEIYNGLPYWEAWFLSSGTLSVTGKFDAQAWGIGGGGFPNPTAQNGYNPLGGRGSASVVSVTLEGDVAVTIGEGAKNGASPGGNTMIGDTVVGAGGQPATPGTGAPYRFADPEKAGEAGETQSNNSFGYGEGGWLHWDGSEFHYNGRGYGAAGGTGNASGYCAAHDGAMAIRIPIDVAAKPIGTPIEPDSGADTPDAPATAGDLLSGKTAYVGGVKVTGTIPSKAAATITPGTSDQTIAAGQYLAGAQTIKGDANLLAENIAHGVSIFGVVGALSANIKSASGSAKPTSAYSYSITGLTFRPKIVIVDCKMSGTLNATYIVVITPQIAKEIYKSGDTFTARTVEYTTNDDGITITGLNYVSGEKDWYAYG